MAKMDGPTYLSHYFCPNSVSIVYHFIPKLPLSLDMYTLEFSPRYAFSPRALFTAE